MFKWEFVHTLNNVFSFVHTPDKDDLYYIIAVMERDITRWSKPINLIFLTYD